MSNIFRTPCWLLIWYFSIFLSSYILSVCVHLSFCQFVCLSEYGVNHALCQNFGANFSSLSVETFKQLHFSPQKTIKENVCMSKRAIRHIGATPEGFRQSRLSPSSPQIFKILLVYGLTSTCRANGKVFNYQRYICVLAWIWTKPYFQGKTRSWPELIYSERISLTIVWH